MNGLPLVSCLCPTYARPRCLETSIACFLAQDYPGPAELLIVDDYGQYGETFVNVAGIRPAFDRRISIFSLPRRFSTLPEKFNAIAALAHGDPLVVWEDDDVYLPWHLTVHMAAIELARVTEGAEYSKPSQVWSDYPGHLVREAARGRFHASIAFSRAHFCAVGGWPITPRADFDQQFLARLGQFGQADPCARHRPSYVFRWCTGHYHGQAHMSGPHDEHWYDKAAEDATPRPLGHVEPVELLRPALDDSARRIYHELAPGADLGTLSA